MQEKLSGYDQQVKHFKSVCNSNETRQYDGDQLAHEIFKLEDLFLIPEEIYKMGIPRKQTTGDVSVQYIAYHVNDEGWVDEPPNPDLVHLEWLFQTELLEDEKDRWTLVNAMQSRLIHPLRCRISSCESDSDVKTLPSVETIRTDSLKEVETDIFHLMDESEDTLSFAE
ncbi:uncharacterized protein BDR25DRAFT_318849 [Lindgomyces ingoldianus]|uniref:Uncharacterized protein n=1 Tax=Lindgomyces ingoldianus TaxID=673940 RepID=A0ACB6QD01_9PLEO|nr:uncharacterized protein BDR25DRAFT_318849 [Lindgomyces ingoldianus]KAF2464854.1 hypothetical protein BDR25DRAFT_318849 [Lindgomyces ingoldianus]